MLSFCLSITILPLQYFLFLAKNHICRLMDFKRLPCSTPKAVLAPQHGFLLCRLDLVESSYRKSCKEHFWIKNQGINIWPSFFYYQFILSYLRGVLGISERINICSSYLKKKDKFSSTFIYAFTLPKITCNDNFSRVDWIKN